MAPLVEPSAPATRGRRPALLSDIVADFDVTILPLNATSRPRCTKAGATLAKLLAAHVEAHLRDLLTIILENESESRELALVAPITKAVSDVLLAHHAAYERNAGTGSK
ncbi:hypothetical protein RDV64_01640 [Acuticoccus sp. MNP-M23]|uniref:hypothetical protein n=1 Tax=Acuticoccus sp. MNP-M23 TaxID=3072793 RepID=UPI002814B932|nr:hypothetical protein [Acuticoccus sp. MNP-M23]WMS43133.1 hypothetical protein RDV64_01640 [Acuticoccus sp. MNP-M23]